MLLSIRADGGSDDRSPWGDFFFTPVPFRGGAMNVTPDAAMQLTAVMRCVIILAEQTAKLPFTLFRMDGKKRTLITDHWLYRLFSVRPNRFQNPMQFREMMQAHMALRGNAYAQIISSGPVVTDLIPIHPDRMQVELLGDMNWRFRVKNQDGSTTTMLRDEVFHVKSVSLDGILGLNPIAVNRESVGLGLAAQQYGIRFFENDTKPGGGWIEYPGKFADKDQKALFKKQWNEQHGGRKARSTAVLEHGMKYHELTINNDEAQFLESRKFQVTEIARLFGIPPHMISDLERSTNNNIEQQSLEFVMYTLTSWLERWEAAIEYAFLAGTDDEDLEVEFPVRNLLRGDSKARAEFYGAGILDGWLTRNEAREDDGRDPLDGLDKPLVPLNMVEEGQQPAPGAQEAAPANKPGQLPNPEKPNGRAEALAFAAADRLARRELAMVVTCRDQSKDPAEAYEAFAAVLVAALAIDEGSARAYCVAQRELAATDFLVLQFQETARSRLAHLALTGELQ